VSSRNLFHALGLHMHQPPGNLKLLIESNPFEAEQIIRCYERAVRYAERYPEEARLHVGFSGILLEQLRDPAIVDAYRHILDIPEMLERYGAAGNVELIGMGYYHPIFPLIPVADWQDQLLAGRQILEDTFGRGPQGFWPPEMAFTMEMVPALVKAGYRYVVVDGVHVRPEDGVHDICRPYLACEAGACITVVPRDRDISNAQESGFDPGWFAREARNKVAGSPHPGEPRLITTWSDGENGGWFRQLHEESGFFGHYFAPCMEHVRYGEYPVLPVALSAYLARHPAGVRAHVQTGAWNVGSTSGYDFAQWAGSPTQRAAVEALQALSRRYHAAAAAAGRSPVKARRALERAHALLLEAETSCFLFWGDAWVPQLHERARAAQALLEEAAAAASPAGPRAPAQQPASATAPAAPPAPPAPPLEPAAAPSAGTKPTGEGPASSAADAPKRVPPEPVGAPPRTPGGPAASGSRGAPRPSSTKGGRR
jgi:alpha-amylase/alpha-mannosidase (GH57 family)